MYKNSLKKCLYNIMMNISLENNIMENIVILFVKFMKMNEGGEMNMMKMMLMTLMKCFSENVMLLVVMKCYEMNGGRKMEKGQGVP